MQDEPVELGQWSWPDARHLPGKHDQKAHGHGSGATGQAALDAAPAKFTPGPKWNSGSTEGARLDAPAGAGSAKALGEYQGTEFQDTNYSLRRNKVVDDATTERIADIDKTMRASPLSEGVQVHRVIRDGERVFGQDTWYGDVSDDDWDAGVRPNLTGLKWKEHAYVSTSADHVVVDHYADRYVRAEDEAIVLSIHAPAGTGAVQLSGFGNGQEAELLLDRGLTLQIVHDHGLDAATGRRALDVEVVDG